MTIIQALILSLVEGITEFLPVSSTGHLILTSYFLGISQTPFVKSFELFIQLGAILAVVSMYGRSVLTNTKLFKHIAVAFVPTAIVGFALYPFIKKVLLEKPIITAASLAIGGIILIAFEKWNKKSSKPTCESLDDLPLSKAFIVGVAQSVSVIPGVSRAAATIIGGLLVGLSRQHAVEFSFLLAIPTIAAATGYDLLKSSWQFSSSEFLLLTVGFIGAFVSAFVAIRFFVDYTKNHSLSLFGVYRIIIAILFLFVYL